MESSSNSTEQPAEEVLKVDLPQPALAALLGWLVPGAGHLYQGRYGKGLLFMVCILSTFFFGLSLGGGHSVYASNKQISYSIMYAFQLGTGLPAMPALVQALRVSRNQTTLWNGFMAPPMEERDLSEWNNRYGSAYDLGILYTMVAGLLNLLAVYDAYGGPHLPPAEDKKGTGKKPDEEKSQDKPPNEPATSKP
jgi:TM2 domain-containing membrane protein YozV